MSDPSANRLLRLHIKDGDFPVSLSYDDTHQPLQTLLDNYATLQEQQGQEEYYLINTDTLGTLPPLETISAHLSILKKGRVKLVPHQMWEDLQKQELTRSQVRNSYLNGIINIIATDGNKHCLKGINSTMTLVHLKTMIQMEIGVPSDRCRLFLSGE